MRFARTLPSLLLLALVLLFAVAPGCGADPEPAAAAQLRTSFPEQAAAVLEHRDAFVAADAAFTLRAAEATGATPATGTVRAALPRLGEGAIRLDLGAPGDFSVRVRELDLDLEGEGALAGGAVAYRRAGGTAFWAAHDAGVEEWLMLDAGLAVADHVVATWEVEGARVQQVDGRVEIVDDAGAVRVRVTAPHAYAAGGREVTAKLAVDGAQITLSVDAGGDAVLVDPAWLPAGTMNVARWAFTATLLASGKVLAAGGGNPPFTPTAELWDPATNLWTPTPTTMVSGRAYHTATLLNNGKVLVVGGGYPPFGVANTNKCELYDPATNTWANAPSMVNPRGSHVAVLLSNNSVLVAGGGTATAEIYNPLTNAWTTVGSMSVARDGHAGVRLANNKVLVSGGTGGGMTLATAEIFDTATNAWTLAASLATARTNHTMTLLNTGKVLAAAGFGAAELASAELYDATLNTWSAAAPLAIARQQHTATWMPSLNRVLITGGNNPVQNTAALYDPATNTWAATASMAAVRSLHTATLLSNGQVLVAGTVGGATAEIYSVANGTPCALGSECASGYCADGFCCNTACAGVCQACSAAKTGGVNGTCASVTVATDPDNECAAQAQSTCGTTGSCSGAGACQQFASGLTCLASSCSGSTLTNASTCNGTGTCVAGSQVSCGAYQCSGAACGTTCVLPTDCTAGNVCIAGKCVAPLPVGSVCTTANQCSSGFCADGFCCGTACGGLCQACSAAKTGGANGTCGSVIAATDPDNECAAQATSTCGTNGSCDGVGACQKYVTGTSCVAPSCSGSTLNNGSDCNGSGTCISKGTTPCDPYVCGVGAACKTLCVSNADCTAGNLCIGGKCGSPLPDGSICLSAGSCQSGNCVDGVCCNTACNGGACDACSKLAGAPSDGVCAMLTGNKCNDGDPCTQTDTCMAGTCMGLAVTCAALDACHTAGTCDATTGACTNPVASDGTTCNDGDGCTQADTCMLGTCVGGSPVVCVAQDSCHGVGVCNPKLGACDNPTLADDTPCDDGNKCTQSDKCTAGICASATPTDCPAIDACHLPGTCDLATGMCPNAETQTAKDCTIVGECDTGGACDPASGACTKTAKPDGSPCTNGVCLAGTCDGAGTGSASTGSASTGSTGSASTGSAGTGSAGTGSAGTGSNSTGAGGSTSGGAGSGGTAGDGSVSPAGGCGCTTVGETSESRAPWLLLGLLLVVKRRRRAGAG
ncbi:MAG: kelch repeat-containing protein [Byssovorax sp.]